MKIYNLIILFLLITTLSCCSKKNSTFSSQSKNNKDLVTQAKQQILAIPVGYKLKTYSESQKLTTNSELFVYVGNMNISQICNFYKKELEFGGWMYSDLSTKKEGLLTANKEFKKVAISIRPIKENSSSIHIFIKDKKIYNIADNFTDLNKINSGN